MSLADDVGKLSSNNAQIRQLHVPQVLPEMLLETNGLGDLDGFRMGIKIVTHC